MKVLNAYLHVISLFFELVEEGFTTEAGLGSDLSGSDMSSVNEVNHLWDITSFVKVHKCITSCPSLWISWNDNLVNRCELFDEVLDLVDVGIVWHVHEVHASGKHAFFVSGGGLSLVNHWLNQVDNVVDSPVIKLSDSILRVLL